MCREEAIHFLPRRLDRSSPMSAWSPFLFSALRRIAALPRPRMAMVYGRDAGSGLGADPPGDPGGRAPGGGSVDPGAPPVASPPGGVVVAPYVYAALPASAVPPPFPVPVPAPAACAGAT